MSAPLLKAREVGEMLGMSTAWVLDKWEAGALPGFRVGGRAVRFRESEILEWLEARRRGPALESIAGRS
jgi:excisionase family DNA binding protein